jgi:hypothetical protein
MFVERDEMRNVDVTVVLLREYILSYLVAATVSGRQSARTCRQFLPVDVDILEVELEDEVDQLFLDLAIAFASIDRLVFAKQAERIH